MTDSLRVRCYNVRFGDAILVSVPDRNPKTHKTQLRHILLDVGNAPAMAGQGGGGDDSVLQPVVADILKELKGAPLDLYVMTHEHLDHVQGLFFAASKSPELRVKERLKARYVWLTASAAPDYYERHEDAKKKKLAYDDMYTRLQAYCRLHMSEASATHLSMLANNDPTKTAPCVEFIRKLNPNRTIYVHRGMCNAETHPFKEAQLHVWAPEEDTSEYYGSFQPVDAGVLPVSTSSPRQAEHASDAALPTPPSGVDLGAFMRLVAARRSGIADNILAIDQAANNTSIVFSLEWRGWRLLFAGDAELRSWKEMQKRNLLQPVHFLKVAHHGSHNGTPNDTILESILPSVPHDHRTRTAAISTWSDTYSGIPHPPTNARLASRCELVTTLDAPERLYFDVHFPA